MSRIPGPRSGGLFARGLAALVRALFGTPVRAARGTARRVVDPARQIASYWASERVTIRQGLVAVSIAAVTSLVAGLTLAGMEGRLLSVTGLFVLIPVSIGMRGAIFGALAARLGTSIHSGLFGITRDREGVLGQNIYAAALLTIATSVAMGVLADGIATLLGIETVSVWDFISIALLGGLFSSAIVLAVTVVLSIQSFRRNWDLDSVGAPLITAVGDVVTLPLLFLASFVVELAYVTLVVALVGIAAALFSIARGWRTDLPIARRVFRESFPILSVAIVLNVLAGTVVEPRLDDVFTPFPALLIVIPGFLELTGALGGILAARLGSKLHIGAVTPGARPDPLALLDGTIALALGIAVYGALAVMTFVLAEVVGVAHPGVGSFIGAVLLGGVLATLLAAVIGYYAAITTYRFGFDPDNHTIPLVTSGMDLMGVICLVIGLAVFGVA